MIDIGEVMFEDYQGFIDLDQVLKEHYQYDFDGDEISFFQQEFVEFEGNGIDAYCWIKYKGIKYLFKRIEDFDYRVWGELVSSEIARELKIPCAEYRAGSLHGKKGIISKSFLTNDSTLKLGSELFQKFCESDQFNKGDVLGNKTLIHSTPDDEANVFLHFLNNLEQVKKIILNQEASVQQKNQIIFFFTQMFLFDLITLQTDRHSHNWGIIQEKNNIHLCPLFDNSACFGLGIMKNKSDHTMYKVNDLEYKTNIFQSEFMNAVSFRNKKNLYSIIYNDSPSFVGSIRDVLRLDKYSTCRVPDIFKNFLLESDTDTIDFIRFFLDEASHINLAEKIEQLEIANGIHMNNKIFFYIVHMFEENVMYLNEIFNSYERGFYDESKRGAK